ncbi:Glycogenin-1 [Sparganum proliferum]
MLPRETFVTLTTNDTYSIGALVLGHSLRLVNTKKELTVLITEGVPHSFRHLLRKVYDNVIVVKQLQSTDNGSAFFLNRPNLGTTYTKLHCWKLTEFSKAVFLDADIIALQNIDDLFEYEEFSAAPDTSWPDMFNSGVFVFKPSLTTYAGLLKLASTESSFDGGDQGLLNEYFHDWNQLTLSNHLPFAYNCSCWVLPNDINIFYTRAPAWKKFNSSVRAAHFTGLIKPWVHRMAANDGAIIHAMNMIDCSASVYTTAEQTGVLAFWWAVFFKFVKPVLSEDMFLANTWDPVLPAPPPPPPSHSPWSPPQHYSGAFQQSEPWNRPENYHPEFHDTSFYDMHAGQRTDQTGAYKEYHEFQVTDNTPKEPEHHRHYQQHHHHQQQEQPQPAHHHHHYHHDHHMHHQHYEQQQQQHQEQRPQPQQEQQQQQQQQHHQQQYSHSHGQGEGDQYWEKENRHCSASEHVQPGSALEQKTAPPVPDDESQCRLCHPDLRAPPTDSQPQAPASMTEETVAMAAAAPEVTTPLYYAPRTTCSECLREMKWSRHYIDPINRHLMPEILPLPARSATRLRIRPRSLPLGLAKLQYFQPTSPGPSSTEGQMLQNKVEPDGLERSEHGPRANSRQKVTHNKLHQVQKPRPQDTTGKKRSSRTSKSKLSGEVVAKETPFMRFILEDPCTKRNGKHRPPTLKTLPDDKKPIVAAQQKGIEPPVSVPSDTAGAACDMSPLAKEKDVPVVSSINVSYTEKIAEEGKSITERTASPLSGKIPSPVQTARPIKLSSSKGDTMTISTRGETKHTATLPKLDVTQEASRRKKTRTNQDTRKPIPASSPGPIFPRLDREEKSPTAAVEASGPEGDGWRENESLMSLESDTHAKREAPSGRIKKSIGSLTSQGMKPSRSIPQMNREETAHLCERHRPRPPPPEWKMYAWERGEIDYMGADRFSNILARIRSTIQAVDVDNLPIGTWL